MGFVAACTPLGVSRMFTVMGELIVKPKVSSRDTVSVWHIVPWVMRMFMSVKERPLVMTVSVCKAVPRVVRMFSVMGKVIVKRSRVMTLCQFVILCQGW